ncbi:MAG: 23S rRNA (guanosine(2251)-2'-O)-methyltransferase RlmB [Deltaproteobacteria bacterium]|nr:23S rRNA (guanosine(2251)-2'-O)-methyltransferase RlmB [Deltaproteobacteria bacterium]
MGRRGASSGGKPSGGQSERDGTGGGSGGIRRHRRGERVHATPSSPPPPPGSQTRLGFDRDPGRPGPDEVPTGEGRILLGPHAVGEALRAGRREVLIVYLAVGEKGERFREVARLARSRGVTVRQAEPELIETLAAGRAHQGIVALAGDYPYLGLAEFEQVVAERGGEALIVALDQIQDPQNLGAILRSCVAFGVDVVVLPERRAASVTEAVVRASAGATELCRIARVPNLAEVLRRLAGAGVEVVGLDPEGESSVADAGLRLPLCLVLGSEGPGMRRLTGELCHRRLRIRIAAGGVASLNVSVSAGIVLHAVRNFAPPPA